MSDPRCETCRFWRLSKLGTEGALARFEIEEGESVGSCCRNAPRPTYSGGRDGSLDIDWPRTISKDWCGEYAPKGEERWKPETPHENSGGMSGASAEPSSTRRSDASTASIPSKSAETKTLPTPAPTVDAATSCNLGDLLSRLREAVKVLESWVRSCGPPPVPDGRKPRNTLGWTWELVSAWAALERANPESVLSKAADTQAALCKAEQKIARLVEERDEAREELRERTEACIDHSGDYICSECCVKRHTACIGGSVDQCDCVTCLRAGNDRLKQRAEQAEAALRKAEAARDRLWRLLAQIISAAGNPALSFTSDDGLPENAEFVCERLRDYIACVNRAEEAEAALTAGEEWKVRATLAEAALAAAKAEGERWKGLCERIRARFDRDGDHISFPSNLANMSACLDWCREVDALRAPQGGKDSP